MTRYIAEPNSQEKAHRSSSLIYSKLYKETIKSIGRKLSHKGFSLHLKKLVEWKSVQMEDTRRKGGTKVFYCITEKGLKQLKLGLKDDITEDQREKAFHLLFLYCTIGDKPDDGINVFDNKEDLDLFLFGEFGLRTNDFKIESDRYNDQDLYKVTSLVNKNPYVPIRYSTIEYLKGSKREGTIRYSYHLPGISIRQFLQGAKAGGMRPLEHIIDSLSQDEVADYFKHLVKEKILQVLLTFHNEQKYDLIDDKLKAFIGESWIFYGITLITMQFIWRNVRAPTEDEQNWYELIWGKHSANIYLNQFYFSRKQRVKDPKRHGYYKYSQNIGGYIRGWGYNGITKKYQELIHKYAEVTKKYSALTDTLLKVVYPEFIRALIARKEI